MLETKWSFLENQTATRSNIDGMYEAYIANLRRQLDGLGNDKLKLEGELKNMQGMVEDFKNKWVQLDKCWLKKTHSISLFSCASAADTARK